MSAFLRDLVLRRAKDVRPEVKAYKSKVESKSPGEREKFANGDNWHKRMSPTVHHWGVR
jgi:hypothetical protein